MMVDNGLKMVENGYSILVDDALLIIVNDRLI